jgi:hypothetical protein
MVVTLNGETVPKISYIPIHMVDKIEALRGKLEELLKQGKIYQFSIVPLDHWSRSTLRIPGDFNYTHVCVSMRDNL